MKKFANIKKKLKFPENNIKNICKFFNSATRGDLDDHIKIIKELFKILKSKEYLYQEGVIVLESENCLQ